MSGQKELERKRWRNKIKIFTAFVLVNSDQLQEGLQTTKSENEDLVETWSTWSTWTDCSRTCDGGASYQLRRCNKKAICRGETIRYRICNTQPCPPNSGDFRAQQCSAYNDVPYQGNFYEWIPAIDPSDSCRLACKAKNYKFVVALAPKVLDGTRCREGSLDMCINGKCQAVGCDLKLGSTLKVDECGICGGDGSLCGKPVFIWHEMEFSSCSLTCGGGFQVTSSVCMHSKNGNIVDERLCDHSGRPIPKLKECNNKQCPSQWRMEEWEPCSASCGGGIQSRVVYCSEAKQNNTHIKVSDDHCGNTKPQTEQKCNIEVCPQWLEGKWSQCSGTCGQGYQSRTVLCVHPTGYQNLSCNLKHKPLTKQVCHTGVPCIKGKENTFTESSAPLIVHEPVELGSATASAEPGFVTGPWGSCSATCGPGVKARSVQCKIYLEFSQTVAQLPDSECPGPKPPDVAPCMIQECKNSGTTSTTTTSNELPGVTGVEVTYSWRFNDYTPCSASCLGGHREAVIECTRDHDQSLVSPHYCDSKKKPRSRTQSCNDIGCPPRWNVSEFSGCSQSCGGGIRVRDVQCFHELKKGANGLMLVSKELCPHPPPRSREFCNVVECPAFWQDESWGLCSKTCGPGLRTRQVRCLQVLSLGQVVNQTDYSRCPPNRPPVVKSCNEGTCPVFAPTILSSNKSYVQRKPKDMVILKIGGSAVLIEGTNIRIKCPVQEFNRSKIRWLKDGIMLRSFQHMQVTRFGALKIKPVMKSDAGIYTCVAGNARENIKLYVKTQEDFDMMTTITTKLPTPHSTSYNNLGNTIDKENNSFTHYLIHRNSSNAIIPVLSQHKVNPGNRFGAPKNHNISQHSHRLKLYSDQESSETGDQDAGNKNIPDSNNENLIYVRELISKIHKMVEAEEQAQNGIKGMSLETNRVVLGKGNPESLEFEWLITPWSDCSETCGGNGFQVRASQCLVKLNNVSKTVDNSLCIDAGLHPPNTLQTCGWNKCPVWITGDWIECSMSECFSFNTAIQKREVLCLLPNKTRVNDSSCDEPRKPQDKRECNNELCQATWAVGEWSECTVSCGLDGIRSRILQCVWYNTKMPAGNMCRDMPRPPVIKECKAGPCPTGISRIQADHCFDTSKYCSLAATFQLCRMSTYKSRCCQTCSVR